MVKMCALSSYVVFQMCVILKIYIHNPSFIDDKEVVTN